MEEENNLNEENSGITSSRRETNDVELPTPQKTNQL